MSFLDLTALGLATSPTDLANLTLAYLEAQIAGYVPNPGNLEVIYSEGNGLQAADVAQAAAVVPSAIFRKYGTQLVGVPYLNGASAQTQVTFTLTDTAGHTVPAGTVVTLGGLGFFTQADLVVPPASSTGTVTVVAVATGSAYNGVSTPIELLEAIDFVASVAVTGPSFGGVDQEADTDYQNRLVTELTLQAPRPITASDYGKMALSFPPAPGTDQEEVGRATAIDGYNPASTAFTANTNSTTTLASVSSFTGISAASGGNPGSIITGSGIPAGTTVVSVNTGAGTLMMSHAATATATGVSLSSVGSYGNPRMVGVWITAADGTALNSDTLAAVAAWFETYREVNFIVNVLSPTYTPVYVDSSIHPYPGFDPTIVAASVQAAVINFLSPPGWGQSPPFGNIAAWLNAPYVRYDKLVAVVQNVAGVDYVPTGSLTVGLAASPSGVVDVALPGPAPMPTSTTTSVPLPAVV